MADKKYFWLKLPRNFFDKHYVKMLMTKENGVDLTLFYIRLLTESIDHEGRLRYSDTTPYSHESLAAVTSFSVGFVDYAMETLIEMELAVVEVDGTIFLPKSLKMIGSESASAERVRRFRDKQKELKTEETKEEQKKEKKKKPDKPKMSRPEYKEIIDYFNEKAGTRYKHTTKSMQSLVNARLNDGFSVGDFKAVIDIKVKKWLNDPKMRDYLRPETLFAASHFESYLNEATAEKPKSQTKYAGLSERLMQETSEGSNG